MFLHLNHTKQVYDSESSVKIFHSILLFLTVNYSIFHRLQYTFKQSKHSVTQAPGLSQVGKALFAAKYIIIITQHNPVSTVTCTILHPLLWLFSQHKILFIVLLLELRFFSLTQAIAKFHNTYWEVCHTLIYQKGRTNIPVMESILVHCELDLRYLFLSHLIHILLITSVKWQ